MYTFSDDRPDLRELSPVALAFVGDSVLDLLVRGRLVTQNRLQTGALHRAAADIVSARGQSDILAHIEQQLTEEEKDWVRRGRNTKKTSVSKYATLQEYQASTGLEAMLGGLYLQGKNERIQEVFEMIWQRYQQLHPAAP